MTDYSSNIGNDCPGNAGGHEPAQYGDPLQDATITRFLDGGGPMDYGCTMVLKICKHCGSVYGVSMEDID